jgi:hypothetical protein
MVGVPGWRFPTLEKRTLTASSTYTIYKILCPNGDILERQKPTAEARGKIRGR